MDHIPDSIYFKDKRARFVRVSDSKAEHLGVEKDEIIGKTDFEFYPKEQAQEMFEDDINVIEEEEPIIGKEEKVTRPDGTERWVSVTKIPRYNKDGDLTGTLGISRDITERKKARKKERFLNSLLRHDFKTKTQICKGYLELEEKTELSSNQKKYLKKTEEVIQSEMDLVEKVSKLKKVEGEVEAEEINLDPIIKDAIEKNKLRAEEKGIKIEYKGCKYSGKGGELLEILFSNLIENSIKHSEADLIKLRAQEEKDKIVVIIEDNGEGIPDENKEKIFQKGFKKGRNAGSGLGTHLAEKIAEKYEGSIEAKDSKMGGARFDVQIKKHGT